jgi:transposase
MARQRIELAPEEAEELNRRARATTVSVRGRRRAEIILLGAQGLTQQRIAEQLGISRLAVNRWVLIVRGASPESLADRPTRSTRANAAQPGHLPRDAVDCPSPSCFAAAVGDRLLS